MHSNLTYAIMGGVICAPLTLILGFIAGYFAAGVDSGMIFKKPAKPRYLKDLY